LATVNHREERLGQESKKGEFRCPLCQRLSNCLVPFIDVGVDWVDEIPETPPMYNNSEEEKSPPTSSLNKFLEVTPWWMSRKDAPYVWDGRCAFIPAEVAQASAAQPSEDDHNTETMDTSGAPVKSIRRRSFRAPRKRDLYVAWNALMKTPRLIRKRQGRRGLREANASEDSAISSSRIQTTSTEENSGESEVWRRLMDHIAEISLKADIRRLGEEKLRRDYGEFRHFLMEKAAYNFENRLAGIDTVDWPSCLLPTSLSDSQKHELPREKVISKMMTSVQAFTYSCMAEASEARRQLLIGTKTIDSNALLSKYGVKEISDDGNLLILPIPSPDEEDGTQPFRGRMGKLRYLALATMAAAGAVSNEIVQLAFSFPVLNSVPKRSSPLSNDIDSIARAPITYPILVGHVLTHVTAAIIAASGYVRARKSSLDNDTFMKLSKLDMSASGTFDLSRISSSQLVSDCLHFVELGLIARVLQSLLGTFESQLRSKGVQYISQSFNKMVLAAVNASWKAGVGVLLDQSQMNGLEESWIASCAIMLTSAISGGGRTENGDEMETEPFEGLPKHREVESLTEIFLHACTIAKVAGVAFLSDIAVVIQILIPGFSTKFKVDSGKKSADSIEFLSEVLGVGTISSTIESGMVKRLLHHWYKQARSLRQLAGKSPHVTSSSVANRLSVSSGHRAFDWPTTSMFHFRKKMNLAGEEMDDGRVPLLGDTAFEDSPVQENSKPRIKRLPTSYTDLYAELGTLSPSSEQTALCLVCGEILNAAGKGECTDHAYKCGAGSGVFFLLQECVSLIVYGGKAAYIHSPYVDSHGETPQYRGRPLNLDMNRYGILQELWSGHLVREKVVSERGSSRQVIIPGYY